MRPLEVVRTSILLQQECKSFVLPQNDPETPLSAAPGSHGNMHVKEQGRDAPTEVAGRGVCPDVPSSVRGVSVTLDFQALSYIMYKCATLALLVCWRCQMS